MKEIKENVPYKITIEMELHPDWSIDFVCNVVSDILHDEINYSKYIIKSERLLTSSPELRLAKYPFEEAQTGSYHDRAQKINEVE